MRFFDVFFSFFAVHRVTSLLILTLSLPSGDCVCLDLLLAISFQNLSAHDSMMFANMETYGCFFVSAESA